MTDYHDRLLEILKQVSKDERKEKDVNLYGKSKV